MWNDFEPRPFDCFDQNPPLGRSHFVRDRRAWWQRGLRFGGVMLCWSGVLMGVGLTMAGVDAALRRREDLRSDTRTRS